MIGPDNHDFWQPISNATDSLKPETIAQVLIDDILKEVKTGFNLIHDVDLVTELINGVPIFDARIKRIDSLLKFKMCFDLKDPYDYLFCLWTTT